MATYPWPTRAPTARIVWKSIAPKERQMDLASPIVSFPDTKKTAHCLFIAVNELSTHCPSDFPYTFDDGQKCCNSRFDAFEFPLHRYSETCGGEGDYCREDEGVCLDGIKREIDTKFIIFIRSRLRTAFYFGRVSRQHVHHRGEWRLRGELRGTMLLLGDGQQQGMP